MRLGKRSALLIAVALGASIVLPRPGAFPTPEAAAQVIPSPPPSPSPTPSPQPTSSPSPSPSDDPPPDKDPGTGGPHKNKHKNKHRERNGHKGRRGHDHRKDTHHQKTHRKGNDGSRHGGSSSSHKRGSGHGGRGAGHNTSAHRGSRGQTSGGTAFYSPQGSFSTAKLVAVAAKLRGLGWSERRILRHVYAPFIVGGEAAWINTWGAPRYGPAPGEIRTHEGQDVFCQEGDPVLAAERGHIEFDEGGLGGKVARLHLPSGWYWYYAHLSGFNPRLSNGDPVEPGDVVGYCGNTGNAAGGATHVHFSLYDRNFRAHDPMASLVRWLHRAERRAGVSFTHSTGKRVENLLTFTTARRFGEGLVPVPSYEKPSLGPLADSTLPPPTSDLVLAAVAAAKARGVLDSTEGLDALAARQGSGHWMPASYGVAESSRAGCSAERAKTCLRRVLAAGPKVILGTLRRDARAAKGSGL